LSGRRYPRNSKKETLRRAPAWTREGKGGRDSEEKWRENQGEKKKSKKGCNELLVYKK